MKNSRKRTTPSNGSGQSNGHSRKVNKVVQTLKKYEMKAVNGGYGIAEAIINGILGLLKSTKKK